MRAVTTINNGIRPYEGGDHNEVIALWNDCFSYPAPHNNPESAIQRKIALNDSLFFVAEVAKPEAVVIGTVMAGWDGHRGWIYSLAVAEGHRKNGVGRALVLHAVKELKRLGCPKVNLQVMPENEAVIGFYEKLGFRSEERISMGLKLY